MGRELYSTTLAKRFQKEEEEKKEVDQEWGSGWGPGSPTGEWRTTDSGWGEVWHEENRDDSGWGIGPAEEGTEENEVRGWGGWPNTRTPPRQFYDEEGNVDENWMPPRPTRPPIFMHSTLSDDSLPTLMEDEDDIIGRRDGDETRQYLMQWEDDEIQVNIRRRDQLDFILERMSQSGEEGVQTESIETQDEIVQTDDSDISFGVIFMALLFALVTCLVI
ncbi:hypothetical protein CPB83DRAFT_900945 [Crepidotus variabilis]|uniref:Uncharacterized protein n=1 Tax=Crepidotus variabilis TaxID=179855 RepID=A0A9P6BBG9_9AGAR|nr:hypothetical protein CPB83DRAFT_900945 [Crepidotus variabilis]